MMEQLSQFNPVIQALAATSFTWGLTALGAALVFLVSRPNQRLFESMLGMAAGVMIAASIFSLLLPAISMCSGRPYPSWIPAVAGFLLGSAFIMLLDRLLPHLHPGLAVDKAEGIRTRLPTSFLLIMAVTLHNIPEGLSVGVAFGSVSGGELYRNLASALAIGIGIQNIPEGLAVALPIRNAGQSRFRAFWFGQLSAAVEPAAGVLGAAAVTVFQPLLPYALGFAAGAMMYVVVEEVIPESQAGGHNDLATFSTLLGFLLMVVLDVMAV